MSSDHDPIANFSVSNVFPRIGGDDSDFVASSNETFTNLLHVCFDATGVRGIPWSNLKYIHSNASRNSESTSHVPSPFPRNNSTLARNSDTWVSKMEYTD
jgi:hypothetical protein